MSFQVVKVQKLTKLTPDEIIFLQHKGKVYTYRRAADSFSSEVVKNGFMAIADASIEQILGGMLPRSETPQIVSVS